MAEEHVLRLRCSEDVERPGVPDKHFALDLRAPMPFATLEGLGSILGYCACGRPMVLVWDDAPDPWDRGHKTPGGA